MVTQVEHLPGARSILVLVDFPDGCRFEMNPSDGNLEGWVLSFPAGFILHCPHGFQVRMETYVVSLQGE